MGRRSRRRQVVAAMQDVRCTACSRTFEGHAAYQVHHDAGQCLPDGACGQLVQLRDGRWAERWRHPDL